MIGPQILSKTTGVPGWHTLAEEDFYIQQAANVPQGGVIVCLGVEFGRCVSEMAAASHDSVAVFGVDRFGDNPTYGNMLEVAQANLAEAGISGVTLIQEDSAKAGQEWADTDQPGVDLLLVDASHKYQDVLDDIYSWLPNIAAGGTILFHDYAKHVNAHALHFEVKQAVDEVFGDTVQHGPDSVVFVRIDDPQDTLRPEPVESEPITDLKTIKGIGPKTEETLKEAGIQTMADLAEAELDWIAEIADTTVETAEKWQVAAKGQLL